MFAKCFVVLCWQHGIMGQTRALFRLSLRSSLSFVAVVARTSHTPLLHLYYHHYYSCFSQLFVIASTAVDWDLPLLFSGYGAGAFGGDYFFWTWGVSRSQVVVLCALFIELLVLHALHWLTVIRVYSSLCLYSNSCLADQHCVLYGGFDLGIFGPSLRQEPRDDRKGTSQDSQCTYHHLIMIMPHANILIYWIFACLCFAAPLACCGLLVWTSFLSKIPVVHGGVFIRGNQHVVSHITSSGIQAQDPLPHRICVGLVLLFVGCGSMFCVSGYHVYLCAIGDSEGSRNESTLARAHDLYASSLCSMCTESKVVIRSVHANFQIVVRKGRDGSDDFQWSVRK